MEIRNKDAPVWNRSRDTGELNFIARLCLAINFKLMLCQTQFHLFVWPSYDIFASRKPGAPG